MKRIRNLFIKEFLQFKRDRRSFAFFLLMPTIQLIIFGYAISTDIKHIPLAVYDGDGHYLGRELVDVMRNTEYFTLKYMVSSEDEIRRLLDRGKIKAGLIIPDGFAADGYGGRTAKVQILIDGSDPNTANTAMNIGNASVKFLSDRISGRMTMQSVDSEPRIWYNPELRSANFMVPGLIGLILQMFVPMMTAAAIVKEREKGTIEQLITTPIKPWELILGKLLPYMAIALIIITVITVAGMSIFSVPMKGDVLILVFFVFTFLLICLSLGLLFSALAQNQLQSNQMVVLMGMPSILLSGLFFPREAMPKAIFVVGYFLPLTYFINLVRGVFIKGVGITYLWDSLLPLLVFEAVIIAISIKKFKKQLG